MNIQKAQYEIATNWLRYYKLLTTGILPPETGSVSTTTISTTTIIVATSTASTTLPAASGPEVKKSTTGICHEIGTKYYDQTIYFTPYNSLQDCLNSGGRLPAAN